MARVVGVSAPWKSLIPQEQVCCHRFKCFCCIHDCFTITVRASLALHRTAPTLRCSERMLQLCRVLQSSRTSVDLPDLTADDVHRKPNHVYRSREYWSTSVCTNLLPSSTCTGSTGTRGLPRRIKNSVDKNRTNVPTMVFFSNFSCQRGARDLVD